MKTIVEIPEGKQYTDIKLAPGYSIWVEEGVYFTEKTVNKEKFGPHRFIGYVHTDRLGTCSCGCKMGGYSSSGPVDPFGACPNNPKNTTMRINPKSHKAEVLDELDDIIGAQG